MQTLDRPTRGALSVLQTPRIRGLVATAQQANPGTPLLICGEPGVGKDVLARLVHAVSPRQAYPFIKVNCRDQALRLIQVLKTGEVCREGGREATRVDVRVIASAVAPAERDNQDHLWRELRRLDTTEVRIPPLRQRADEIPDFASFFAARFSRQYHRDVRLCPETIAAFGAGEWRGNVRELEEAVHELVRGRA
ncbi:MAG: hypothetical protein DME03_21150 [Candidatus Rokuibacteriota bacterium]|nr:MAG: hypothetical protein DME03_21150 [Candidatus Rokubacteria bacterium]